MSPFPADPLDIELTVQSRSPAWMLMGRQSQLWRASADVIGRCDEAVRHVGDVLMWTVPHDRLEPVHPDLETYPGVDPWRLVDAVHAPDGLQFAPELDEFVSRGPRNVLLVESWVWSTPWREMAGPLLAAAIATFAGQVRLAVCTVPAADDTSADLELRAAAVLEDHGWHSWRGLHIADPRSDAIADASLEIMEAWMPAPTPD